MLTSVLTTVISLWTGHFSATVEQLVTLRVGQRAREGQWRSAALSSMKTREAAFGSVSPSPPRSSSLSCSATILRDRFQLPDAWYGGLLVYAALTTLLPSITLAKPFDLDVTDVAAPQERCSVTSYRRRRTRAGGSRSRR